MPVEDRNGGKGETELAISGSKWQLLPVFRKRHPERIPHATALAPAEAPRYRIGSCPRNGSPSDRREGQLLENGAGVAVEEDLARHEVVHHDDGRGDDFHDEVAVRRVIIKYA